MNGLACALWLLASPAQAPANPASAARAQLSQTVAAITAADFRAERAVLRQIASDLERVKDDELAAYRAYWRGFAHWRSAINGANVTPAPADVRSDLLAAIQAFRAADRLAPDWIEPKIGLLFCWTGLAYASGDLKQEVSPTEFLAVRDLLKEKAQDNPRALWFFGGGFLFAPTDKGGDPVRAAETYRRALAAARSEALSQTQTPAWIPRWGAAENLMSLAYLYSHAEPKDRPRASLCGRGAGDRAGLALRARHPEPADRGTPRARALTAGAPRPTTRPRSSGERRSRRPAARSG